MSRLLFTYLFTEILAPFFASLVILTGVLFLGKMVPFLDIIFEFAIGAADFVRLCAYIAPNLLLFSIPMASMMAVILCFTRLAADKEIMAFKAAGIGLYRMLPAVCIFALCTGILTSMVSVRSIPAGTVAMQKLLFQLAKEKFDKGFKEKTFSQGIKGVVLYVDKIDPKTGGWSGVYVNDLRDPENPLTIVARTGDLAARVEDLRLSIDLEDGTMHRRGDDRIQTVAFSSYALDLSLEPPKTIGGQSSTERDKSGMSLAELRDLASRLQSKPEWANPLMIEYHKRLVLPGGCLILTILGLSLTFQTRIGGRARGIPLGLAAFIGYYVCITAAKTMSENSVLPVGVIMWTPNVLFAVMTLYVTYFVAGEKQSRVLAAVAGCGAWLAHRFARSGVESGQ